MTNVIMGAQMFSVRDRCATYEQLLETCKAIKAMGYNTVQFSGQGKDITFAQLRDVLDKCELTCVSTHSSFQRMEEDIEGVIRDHKLLGCEYLGGGGVPEEFKVKEAGYWDFAKKVSPIAQRLADSGLHYIYHNHSYEFMHFGSITGEDILLENTPECMLFELDVFWAQAAGANPVKWIKKIGKRMGVMHYKEMDGARRPVRMVPIGTGNMDWPAIFEATDEIGVKYALIEQDDAADSENSLECMRISHDNLVKLGARF